MQLEGQGGSLSSGEETSVSAQAHSVPPQAPGMPSFASCVPPVLLCWHRAAALPSSRYIVLHKSTARLTCSREESPQKIQFEGTEVVYDI